MAPATTCAASWCSASGTVWRIGPASSWSPSTTAPARSMTQCANRWCEGDPLYSSRESDMIFVIGGTGRLGSPLLQRLAELDAPVRALAHSPASRAKIEGFGAEAVDGDLDELDTFEPALKGCDRVFLLSPAQPDQPEREKAAIDAAARAGVGHVVALSIMGASHDATVGFGRWHAD